MGKAQGTRIFLLILALSTTSAVFAEEPVPGQTPPAAEADEEAVVKSGVAALIPQPLPKLSDAAKIGHMPPFVSNRPMKAPKRTGALDDLPRLGEFRSAPVKSPGGSW